MNLANTGWVGAWRWQLLGLVAVALAAVGGYFAQPGWNGAGSSGGAGAGSSGPQAASAATAAQPVQKKRGAESPAAPMAPAGRPLSPAQAAVDLWEGSNGPKPAGDASAAAAGFEKWRIAAIFQTEKGPEVVVVFDKATPMRTLKVGDALPNRATIVAIGSKSVTVRTLIDGRRTLVVLDL